MNCGREHVCVGCFECMRVGSAVVHGAHLQQQRGALSHSLSLALSCSLFPTQTLPILLFQPLGERTLACPEKTDGGVALGSQGPVRSSGGPEAKTRACVRMGGTARSICRITFHLQKPDLCIICLPLRLSPKAPDLQFPSYACRIRKRRIGNLVRGGAKGLEDFDCFSPRPTDGRARFKTSGSHGTDPNLLVELASARAVQNTWKARVFTRAARKALAASAVSKLSDATERDGS